MKPIIKIETEKEDTEKEDVEEYLQKELTLLEKDVNNCDVSMLKRVRQSQASLSYYLNEETIDQPKYFEYNSQLNGIIRDAIKNCLCKKK